MNNSPMPLKRQLRYLKQCRDNWKQNAAQKQEKIREYVQLTRALQKSRDSWKIRAKNAEQRVKELEKQLASLSSPSLEKSCHDDDSDMIPHHHYRISTISVAVQQFILIGNSYRGISKTIALFSPHSSSNYC